MDQEAINVVVHYDYMLIVKFVLFSLATIGLTNVLVHGKIMDVIGLRGWLKRTLPSDYYSVFECYECSGFWAGMFVGLFFFPYWFVFCGFAGSVLSATYNDLMMKLQGSISFEIPEEDFPEEDVNEERTEETQDSLL